MQKLLWEVLQSDCGVIAQLNGPATQIPVCPEDYDTKIGHSK